MLVNELVTRLSFEADTAAVEKFDSAINQLKNGLIGVGLSLGAAIGSVFAVVKTTAEAGDQLLALSQRTGIAVETLQGLQYAAKLSNVGVEELSQSIGLLNRSVYEAQNGVGNSAKAFYRLGISVSSLKGQKPEDTMLAIADAFQKIDNPAQKAALSQEIFGRSGQRLIPLLNKGAAGIRALAAEQAAFGQFSTEDAKAANEFEDSINRLKAIFVGIKNEVGKGLLPGFTEILVTFKEFVLANREIIKQNLAGFISGLTKVLKVAFSVFKAVIGSVANLISHFKGAEAVTKFFFGALAAISGLAILSGIGTLVAAIGGLIASLTIANATALLIPIGIGAAIALLGLLAEDVYQFFTGGESVTGKFLEYFKTALPGAFAFCKGVFDIFSQSVIALVGAFNVLLSVFRTVTDFVTGTLWPILKPVIGAIGSVLDKGLGAAGGFLSGAAGTTQATVPGVGSGNTSSNANITTQIQVNVPPGTDPASVGQRVQSGVADGLDSVLRTAGRNATPGAAF